LNICLSRKLIIIPNFYIGKKSEARTAVDAGSGLGTERGFGKIIFFLSGGLGVLFLVLGQQGFMISSEFRRLGSDTQSAAPAAAIIAR
jgi:hypothetical protein